MSVPSVDARNSRKRRIRCRCGGLSAVGGGLLLNYSAAFGASTASLSTRQTLNAGIIRADVLMHDGRELSTMPA
jgi:hypothetical protein